MAFVLVAAITALAAWWWLGGTYLTAAGGGLGTAAPVGEPVSVGILLTTSSGPSVVLDAARAPGLAGVHVSWSVYRNQPHQLGFGSWLGPLAPTFPTGPVHGSRVVDRAGHPPGVATWLVMTVVASRPGVYHFDQIDVSYHSGLRPRHTDGNTDVCVLAYPAREKARILAELDLSRPGFNPTDHLDPLVAAYEACQPGHLTP